MDVKPSAPVLYVLSFVASGCGFVTQMLVSGFWSAAYSQDVLHFSLNLAFYFLSLGAGSLLSEHIGKPTLEKLLVISFLLCFWTGVSISLLRLGIVGIGAGGWLPVAVVAVAGTLAGTVVPLTLRLGEEVPGMSLPALLGLDYGAAIVFNGLFTFVLLIPLGYSKTALLLGFACFAVSAYFLFALPAWGRLTTPAMLVALGLPLPLHHAAVALSQRPAADGTRILVNRQSHYQKIVLTAEKGTGMFFPGMLQHVLYLDGFVQFASLDEQSYHACIANIPEAAAETMKNPARTALILGGGDGLAARNLLAMPRIRKVTQVELDPAVIELATGDARLRALNLDSLRSSRLELVLDDAFHWVRGAKGTYDVVIIDFPHPKNLTLARLFSAEFYRHVARLTAPDGFISVQAGPAMDPRDRTLATLGPVPVTVRNTMRAVGLNAHLYTTPRDQDAFVLATPNSKFQMEPFARSLGMVGFAGMGLICSYDPKWREPAGLAINTLNTLPIATHMLDWYRYSGHQFFNYRGVQAAFLPD